MSGRNDFKVIINRRAIGEIADAVEIACAIMPDGVDALVKAGAPRKDVQVALVLLAMQKYLESRRCDPDFKVVLNE